MKVRNMENKVISRIKEFVKRIDRAAGIQLVMISMTLVAYIILLSIQSYLPNFEGSQSKLITIDTLLGIGLLIEFGYFIWHTNKQAKDDKIKTKEKKIEIKKQEKEVSQADLDQN